MKNKSIITISTIYGTRAFHFKRWHSYCLKIISVSCVLTILAVVFNLSYLTKKVNYATELEGIHEKHRSALQLTIDILNSENKNLENNIIKKNGFITNVSTRLVEIEQYLGKESEPLSLENVAPEDINLDSRINIATINSAVRISLLKSVPNGAPVKNARISSKFGYRTHPITHKKRKHNGIDFAVNTGTPIYAQADGVVRTARKSKTGSGNYINIQHSFGFTASFSHLSIIKVKNGDFVEKGQLIAESGNTGFSSGPHLHYEVKFVGKALDPMTFVKWNMNNFESIFKKEKAVKWEFLVRKVEKQISNQLQLLSQVDAELMAQSN
jgi:murein DD-endopeptidase MepM/ murein hydrolase activator NlpD